MSNTETLTELVHAAVLPLTKIPLAQLSPHPTRRSPMAAGDDRSVVVNWRETSWDEPAVWPERRRGTLSVVARPGGPTLGGPTLGGPTPGGPTSGGPTSGETAGAADRIAVDILFEPSAGEGRIERCAVTVEDAGLETWTRTRLGGVIEDILGDNAAAKARFDEVSGIAAARRQSAAPLSRFLSLGLYVVMGVSLLSFVYMFGVIFIH